MRKNPSRLPFPEIVRLVKHHLELAGSRGLTKRDLLAKIGPTRTSLATIQRALNHLRNDLNAQLRCFGKVHRWAFETILTLPLDDPDREDLVLLHVARAAIRPFLDPRMYERLEKILEGFDDRARRRTSPRDLPPPRAVSSSMGTLFDTDIMTRLLAACRRSSLRIRHRSPWRPASTPKKWHDIEPWELRLHEGTFYLRAWVIARGEPRTFRIADITAIEDLDKPTAPRQKPPADVWGDEDPAFGIDHDRPDVAVIRFRGGLARWLAPVVWHRRQHDKWIEQDELLERTFPYRSCRELARRLASYLDGVESISPPVLDDEVLALVSSYVAKRRRARPRSKRA